MSFNRRMQKQELLSREDIDLLLEALTYSDLTAINKASKERLDFLAAKLKRMKS